MKNLFLLILILALYGPVANAQKKDSIVISYLEHIGMNPETAILNHGPIMTSSIAGGKQELFFIVRIDEATESNYIDAVFYSFNEDHYSSTRISEYDFGFSSGVISVFFENIDDSIDQEMIIITEYAGRTFFADGGYAGYKTSYKTLVYKITAVDYMLLLQEYRSIGAMLTVNIPPFMGTYKEEILTGREGKSKVLRKMIGVTSTAARVKERIAMFKANGLLGGSGSR